MAEDEARFWTEGLLQVGLASYELTERLMRKPNTLEGVEKLDLVRTLIALQVAAICDGGSPTTHLLLDRDAPACQTAPSKLHLRI